MELCVNAGQVGNNGTIGTNEKAPPLAVCVHSAPKRKEDDPVRDG